MASRRVVWPRGPSSPRHRPRHPHRPFRGRAATGASPAMTSSKRTTARRRTTQRDFRPSRSRRRRASSRARRDAHRWPSPQVVSPVAQTYGPRLGEHGLRGRLDERPGRSLDRRQPPRSGRHGLDAGIRRDDRVRRAKEALTQELGDLRFADRRRAGTSARRHPLRGRSPGVGAGLRWPTSAASREAVPGARRSPRRPAARTNQPGAVPFGFGRASADGISHACFRLSSGNGMPRRRPQLAQPCLGRRVDHHRLAGRCGDRLARQVVGRRPESAGRNDQVGSRKAVAESGRSPTRDRRAAPSAGGPGRRSDVRLRASSPAFVSRVSPTVSSVPMLRSSAVKT